MKSRVVTQFSCDFCSKKLFQKAAMQKHEDNCTMNPENAVLCLDCAFCNKEERIFHIDVIRGSEAVAIFDTEERKFNVYYCSIIKKMVYSIKAERLLDKYPSVFEEQIPMLKECKHFQVVF